MNTKKLLLPLLAAAVLAVAPSVSQAADTEKSAPCPQRMIGCEHGNTHSNCPALVQKGDSQTELSAEQKAEMKAKCDAMKAELAKKRVELAKKRAEHKAQREKLIKEHHNAVAPLHEQLVQKQMELDVLAPNPNVKPEELKALVAEIISLRKQIRTLKGDFHKELAKLGGPSGKRFHGPEHGIRSEHCPRTFHGKTVWNDDCAPRCPRNSGWHDGPRFHQNHQHRNCENMR